MSSMVAHTFEEKQRTGDVLISENVDFKGLLLSESVLKGLKSADLIVQAKSGTGKTCVFSVIALENLQLDSTAFQAIVLAPTREIAVQIWDVINSIGQAIPSLKCHTFIGGMPLHEDRQKLKKCQIGVGTPGRIKQLIETGIMNVDSVRMFILDEADKLLEESFQEQINWIYSTLPDNKQMLALSATYPEYLAQHLTAYMRNPTFLRLNITDPALLGIKQYFKMVPYHPMPNKVFEDKVKVVVELLSSVNFQQCLIFSNLQTRAHNMADTLTSMGWPTACIAGSHDQKDRNEAMAKLKTYKCRVLISTDLTSRGIDADKVNMVLNLDVPKDHETYLHRIGRAGRFGSFGAAITIISIGQEQTDLQAVEKKCNTHINPLPIVVPSDLCKSDVQIHLDDMVSSEQIITNGATQDSLLMIDVKAPCKRSPPINNTSIKVNGNSHSFNTLKENSDSSIDVTAVKLEDVSKNGKELQQNAQKSKIFEDFPENDKVFDKAESCNKDEKTFVDSKDVSLNGSSKLGFVSRNANFSSNTDDMVSSMKEVDDKPQDMTLKQVGLMAFPERRLKERKNNSCITVPENSLGKSSLINGVNLSVKNDKNSVRNDAHPRVTKENNSGFGTNESVYTVKTGSMVLDKNSEIGSCGEKMSVHSSHICNIDSTWKSPFSLKIPSYKKVIAHQKIPNPHTYEEAVEEFQKQNVSKSNISEIKGKMFKPEVSVVDTDKNQRKELLSNISLYLQQVSENENARYGILDFKTRHLEKKKINTASNENSGQNLSMCEQLWEKLGDIPENTNFSAVNFVEINCPNEEITRSSGLNIPYECSVRNGHIFCKDSKQGPKTHSENIYSNKIGKTSRNVEEKCVEKKSNDFAINENGKINKNKFEQLWEKLGENFESSVDKTSSTVTELEFKNGQLICKGSGLVLERMDNKKVLNTTKDKEDEEKCDKKIGKCPSKSYHRKNYKPFSLGAFCSNMRENNEQGDAISAQVQDNAGSQNLSDSVQLGKVNIKHLHDSEDNFKHLDDSDDTSESTLSSSYSEFSESEISSSTSDEEEEDLDKHVNRSAGRSPYINSWRRHFPVSNYDHGYGPYSYFPYPHYDWSPWYQSVYWYPTHLRNHQYSKLQENHEIQSEYISLMLKK